MNQAEAPLQHLDVIQENSENEKIHVASDSELHDRLREIPSLGSLELDESVPNSSACLVKTTSKPTTSAAFTKRPKILGRTGVSIHCVCECANINIRLWIVGNDHFIFLFAVSVLKLSGSLILVDYTPSPYMFSCLQKFCDFPWLLKIQYFDATQRLFL